MYDSTTQDIHIKIKASNRVLTATEYIPFILLLLCICSFRLPIVVPSLYNSYSIVIIECTSLTTHSTQLNFSRKHNGQQQKTQQTPFQRITTATTTTTTPSFSHRHYHWYYSDTHSFSHASCLNFFFVACLNLFICHYRFPLVRIFFFF